jgi:hypothetical protein
MKLKLAPFLAAMCLLCLLSIITATKNKNLMKSRVKNENMNKNSNQQTINKINSKTEKKEINSPNTEQINIVRYYLF